MTSTWTIDELRRRVARLPRIALTDLPTPFHECPAFARAIGHGVRVFFKRDDLTTIGGGGNKIRKLEFSLAEAKAHGCDAVVFGLAGQSNYCRQTAAAAARVGLPCHLVLRLDHKTDGPPQGNLLLDHVFGANVTFVEADRKLQGPAIDALVNDLKATGGNPYVMGPHDEVLGAVAYSLCMAEILEQQQHAGIQADVICVTGRSGTQAGLVLGKRLLAFPGQVLGFHPAPADDDQSRRGAAAIATRAAELLDADQTFTLDDIHNTSRYGGRAYGEPTDDCLDALLLLGRTEGLLAGPVYAAKGLAGLIDSVKTGVIPEGSTIVFVHTGGIPELYPYNVEIARHAGVAPR